MIIVFSILFGLCLASSSENDVQAVAESSLIVVIVLALVNSIIITSIFFADLKQPDEIVLEDAYKNLDLQLEREEAEKKGEA